MSGSTISHQEAEWTRHELGLTEHEMAEQMGVSVADILSWSQDPYEILPHDQAERLRKVCWLSRSKN